MKHIYETFTDEEHRQLQKAKSDETWHNFIMQLAETKPRQGASCREPGHTWKYPHPKNRRECAECGVVEVKP